MKPISYRKDREAAMSDPPWNQLIAFGKDEYSNSYLEVIKELNKERVDKRRRHKRFRDE